MDKNSLIGIILILGILIGWSVWMTPSKEEIAQQRHIQDSINKVNRERFVRDSISMAEATALMNQQTTEIPKNCKSQNTKPPFSPLPFSLLYGFPNREKDTEKGLEEAEEICLFWSCPFFTFCAIIIS